MKYLSTRRLISLGLYLATGLCLYPLAPWLYPLGALLDRFYTGLGMGRGTVAGTYQALGFIWGSLYYLPQILSWRTEKPPRLSSVIGTFVLACASLPIALICLGLLGHLRRFRDLEGFELYVHALLASGFLGAWVCFCGAFFVTLKSYREGAPRVR